MTGRLAARLAVVLAATTAASSIPVSSQIKAPGFTIDLERGLYGHLFEGPFIRLQGVTFDPLARELFVCDSGGHRIAIATADGVPKFSFGSPQTLIAPSDVAVDTQGHILVADSGHGAIRVFDYDGTPLPDVELTGLSATEREFRPQALALADETLYVIDRSNRRVIVADLEGRVRGELSAPPGRADLIVSPVDLTIAPGGEIVLLDRTGLAVQIYSPNGEFLRGWGEHDTGPANFSAPSGVAVDHRGRVFTTDELRHDVKVFTFAGEFIVRFGGFGAAPGGVRHPVAVASDRQGRVFVAERTGLRVQVFRVVDVDGEMPTAGGE